MPIKVRHNIKAIKLWPKRLHEAKVPLPKIYVSKSDRHVNASYLALFIIVFGALGGYLVFRSFAAQYVVASLQAQQLSLPSGAQIISDSQTVSGKAAVFRSPGTATGSITIPAGDSSTSLTVRARAVYCAGWPRFTLSLDNRALLSQTVASNTWTGYTATVNIGSGTHTITFQTGDDVGSTHGSCQRNLYFDAATFYGPVPSPPTLTLTTSASTVTTGSSTTINWSTANATSCVASGAWSGSRPVNGSSTTGPLTATKTFALACSGAQGTATASVTISVSNSYNVLNYGADPSGGSNSDTGIKAAIAAAEAAGGNETVYFPAGTYILNSPNISSATGTSCSGKASSDLVISGTPTSVVNVLGAGQSTTKIVEEVGNAASVNGQPGPYPSLCRGSDVFAFNASTHDFYFKGLTVDGQTYNAGDSLSDGGNNSTIEDSTFLGAINGNGGSGSPTNPSLFDVWDVRITAFCNQDRSNPNYVGNAANHHSGNTVNNVTLSSAGGVGGNADLGFACQENGTISNITDTGWGTALYLDSNVTVTNYTYRPGSANRTFPGFYITAGHNITISNFTTYGQGGVIKSPNYPSSNIAINNEVMAAGKELLIGDGQTIAINGGAINTLNLAPSSSAAANPTTGALAGGLNGLTVSGATIATVACHPAVTSAPGAIPVIKAPITNLIGISCP